MGYELVSGNFINSQEMGVISIFTMFYTLASLISLNLPDGIMRYLSLYIGENNQEKIQKVINLAFIIYISFIGLLNVIIPITMICNVSYNLSNYIIINFKEIYRNLQVCFNSSKIFSYYFAGNLR